jgi:hypothetical protein
MSHPEAVLRFMSETKANRLCRDYRTPYGFFIEHLFAFVWSTPTVNASVRLEGPVRPACVALRFVLTRCDADIGTVPSLKNCTQNVELLRWLRFRASDDIVEVGRYFIARTAESPHNTWRRDAFVVPSYAEALADTILDYRFQANAKKPFATGWTAPTDRGQVPHHILGWRKGNLLE